MVCAMCCNTRTKFLIENAQTNLLFKYINVFTILIFWYVLKKIPKNIKEKIALRRFIIINEYS